MKYAPARSATTQAALAALLSIAAAGSPAADEGFRGYSLEEATWFRSEWTLENWDDVAAAVTETREGRLPLAAYVKKLTSTLIAVLEDRGLIDTKRSVDFYLPELGRAGWQRATAATAASTRVFIAALPSHRPSGKVYEHTSPDTFVLGWLAEQVAGRTYAELLSQEIWQKMGAEADALISMPRQRDAA